jgi:hypothetical protein
MRLRSTVWRRCKDRRSWRYYHGISQWRRRQIIWAASAGLFIICGNKEWYKLMKDVHTDIHFPIHMHRHVEEIHGKTMPPSCILVEQTLTTRARPTLEWGSVCCQTSSTGTKCHTPQFNTLCACTDLPRSTHINCISRPAQLHICDPFWENPT